VIDYNITKESTRFSGVEITSTRKCLHRQYPL